MARAWRFLRHTGNGDAGGGDTWRKRNGGGKNDAMIKSPLIDTIKAIELEQIAKGSIYPVTIVMDRYGGTYSGGKWLALQSLPSNVPEEIGGSDPEESLFWREHSPYNLPIGKGDTPEQAYKDLIVLAKAYWEAL